MTDAEDRNVGSRRLRMASARPRTTSSGPTAFFVALCLLALTTGAIAAFSGAQRETVPDKTPTDTLRVLDNAILLLGDPSSDYRKVMLDAVAAFPRDVDETVPSDIRVFLARAPKPGGDFRCTVDFVRSRARTALSRLRDTLRHEYVRPVEPAVCYAAPFALDLAQAQTTGGWLDIYGYDFDRVIPEMVLVSHEGYRDVTAALVTRSHYHLALKLGTDAVPLSSESVSLGLTWGHLIHHSVSIIQPGSRLCSSRVETIPAGRIVSYTPSRIRGNGRLGRPGTDVRANATLDYSSNKLEATLCMAAAHPAERDAGPGGCAVEFLYTTDPDRVIEGVFDGLTSQVSYVSANRTSAVKSGGRNGPVRQWGFGGFEPSSLVGVANISVTAKLNGIRLVSVEDDACISPIAYLEARRTTAIDPVTRGSLDSQLKTTESAILKLRPRFALSTP